MVSTFVLVLVFTMLKEAYEVIALLVKYIIGLSTVQIRQRNE